MPVTVKSLGLDKLPPAEKRGLIEELWASLGDGSSLDNEKLEPRLLDAIEDRLIETLDGPPTMKPPADVLERILNRQKELR